MEKKSRHLERHYREVTLYADDLTAVLAVAAEGADTYELETKTFALETIEETGEVDVAELYELSFSRLEPYIHLWTSDYGLHVRADNSGLEGAGLLARIDEEVRKRANAWGLLRRFQDWFGIGGAVLLSVGALVLVALAERAATPLFAYSLAVFLVIVAVFIIARSLVPGELLQIDTSRREAPFLERHRDELILRLVSGGIGLLFGVIATLVTTYLMGLLNVGEGP